MRKKGKSIVISMFSFILLFALLLLLLVLSMPDLGITIDKPLNQSYNAEDILPTSINVTTSPEASSCRYLTGGATQGENWQSIGITGYTINTGGSAVTPDGKMWIVGNYDPYSTKIIKSSTDGITWTSHTSPSWAMRWGHSVAVRTDSSLWIFGGGNYVYKVNDVWNSTDGDTWTAVTYSASWGVRTNFVALVKNDDSFWIIGGLNFSSSNNISGDVWNSTNGADWTLVNTTAITPTYSHCGFVDNDNMMWVMGGINEGLTYSNTVWNSTDGIFWTNRTAPWDARGPIHCHYDQIQGKMWVLPGTGGGTATSDAWYSLNGTNWTQAATGIMSFLGDYDYWSAILNSSIYVIPSGSSVVYAAYAPTPMNGSGTQWQSNYSFPQGSTFIGIECNDSANVWNRTNVSLYLDTILPVLEITYPLNMSYNNTASRTVNVTASETASACLYSLNGATNVTMDGSGTEWGKEFTAAQGSNTLVVSCNDTMDNWNSTAIAFFMDSIKPVLNITRPFNMTYTYTNLTVNVTTNESASICRYAHNTSGLDENWTELNASAFPARNEHSFAVAPDGKMWVIGGAPSGAGGMEMLGAEGSVSAFGGDSIPTALNDVWYSTDGINWTEANASAAFLPRYGHTSVATSDGKIWVIGGTNGTDYYNDTWYSTDGANWIMANASAFPARYGHSSVVDSSGKMWVIAGYIATAGSDPPITRTMGGDDVSISGGMGGMPAPTNTTWYSTDGFSWTQANGSAFPARYSHASAATSDGKIWVFGGLNTAITAMNDVWYSADNASWIMATSSAEWSARYGHVSFSTPDDRLWVMGGTDDGVTNFYNDMWYSANGTSWTKVNDSSWTGRYYSASAVKGSYIYMAGGKDANGNVLNDSWSTPIPPRYINMDGSGTTWGKEFTAAQGNKDIKVRCWDIAGNLNSSMQWFYVDSLGPVITISAPLNQSYTTAPTTVTVSTSETANTCVYSLNGAANVTMTNANVVWTSTFTAANYGNTIIVNCQDLLGNWNSTSIAFYVSVSSGTACGNNVCESGETCTSCSTDCGACTGGTSSSLSGGVTSSKAEGYNFELKANIPVEKTIAKEGVAIEKITLNSKENAEKVNLQVSKYEILPGSIKAPEGNMYQALKIELDKEVELKEAEICFNVEKQWLDDNYMQKEEVVLVRYHPRQVLRVEKAVKSENEFKVSVRADIEEWQELETTLIEKPEVTELEKTEENYCAKTPGFSTFAIVARKQQMIEIIQEAAPIIESIPQPVPEKNEFVIPFSPPYKKLYAILFIDLLLIFALTAAFSTGGNLYEEKKELWNNCQAMVKEAPDSKKVQEFIKASLKRGYSEGDIKQAVAGHGIDETCIDMLIENVKEELMAESLQGK